MVFPFKKTFKKSLTIPFLVLLTKRESNYNECLSLSLWKTHCFPALHKEPYDFKGNGVVFHLPSGGSAWQMDTWCWFPHKEPITKISVVRYTGPFFPNRLSRADKLDLVEMGRCLKIIRNLKLLMEKGVINPFTTKMACNAFVLQRIIQWKHLYRSTGTSMFKIYCQKQNKLRLFNEL